MQDDKKLTSEEINARLIAGTERARQAMNAAGMSIKDAVPHFVRVAKALRNMKTTTMRPYRK